ncbi:MAG: hypothetical protein EOP14_04305 [Pseudomonas sp.]|nr:MAG: hypothetical protein EOP14_04305 [Pseudomonas sp.]
MNHSFDVEHARSYGIPEAILIANLEFWLAKNKANRKHFHDGRTWTYNSAKAYAELFPYLSAHQIRRAIDSLESQGVILKANYNGNAYDKTLWVAFTDSFAEALRPLANLPNGDGKTDKSLTNTDSKPDTSESFGLFWQAYPKKKDKETARKAWGKVPAELHPAVMDALAKQSQSQDWVKEAGKYVPNAATWINGKRWEDEDGDTRTMDIWSGAM